MPPAQDDEDMDVQLPSQDPADGMGNVDLQCGGKANVFRFMCSFATIVSKVYNQLYSVNATRLSDEALLTTIGELDTELQDWKNSIPVNVRPEYEIKVAHQPLILHIVILHLTYYNCLMTIHRRSVHHNSWTSRATAIQDASERPLNPRVFSSAALCVTAARASINLIKYIPKGDFARAW